MNMFLSEIETSARSHLRFQLFMQVRAEMVSTGLTGGVAHLACGDDGAARRGLSPTVETVEAQAGVPMLR
jgi:hypothetical protein